MGECEMRNIVNCGLILILAGLMCSCTSGAAAEISNIWEEGKEVLKEDISELKDDINNVVDYVGDKREDSPEQETEAETEAETVNEEDNYDWTKLAADGTILANIKDQNGYTDYYTGENKFTAGECTWYCYGRFWEETGIKLDKTKLGNAEDWLNYSGDDRVEVVTDLDKIIPGAIAVDYKYIDEGGKPKASGGHVTYIEKVEYDENGKPLVVYFSESNWDITKPEGSNGNDHYDEGVDGKIKKISFEEFKLRGKANENDNHYHEVVAYIVPKK